MAMTMAELLQLHEEMQQRNRDLVAQWIREGRQDVSPAEAAEVLGIKNPYSLNVGAKKHPQPGMYWRGNRLRICISFILGQMAVQGQSKNPGM